MKIFLALFLIIFINNVTFSQDPHFSQYYAIPLYLSPSFTGIYSDNRISTAYRDQWPAVPGKFISYNIAYDKSIDALKSGVGILFSRDEIGSASLSKTNIGLYYSYDIQVNRSLSLRPGLGVYYTNVNIDFYKLIFNDQINSGNINPGSIESPTMKRIGDIDAVFSILSYGEKYWLGTSIDHLFQPIESLYFWDDYNMKKIPIKYSLFGGYKFTKYDRGIEHNFYASFLFKKQKLFNQLDLGAYYERSPLIVGIWYRGIPVFKHHNSSDAIIFMMGLKLDNLKIGYSWDMNISRLVGNTHGSHEITVSYTWGRSRKIRMVPCNNLM